MKRLLRGINRMCALPHPPVTCLGDSRCRTHCALLHAEKSDSRVRREADLTYNLGRRKATRRAPARNQEVSSEGTRHGSPTSTGRKVSRSGTYGPVVVFLGGDFFRPFRQRIEGGGTKRANAAGLVVAAYAWPALIMLDQDPASQVRRSCSGQGVCDCGDLWHLRGGCLIGFSSVDQHWQGHGGLADDESLRRRSGCCFDLDVPRETDPSKGCGVRAGGRSQSFSCLTAR